MKEKTNKGLMIACLVIACVSLSLSAWTLYKSKKTAYVDTLRLFDQYKLKLDLEKKEDLVLNRVKSDADSLKNQRDVLLKEQPGDTASLRQLERQLARLSGIFNQEYSRSNKEINDAVWKRLNPDIDEFAKKEGLELLVGANGMGTVLYGSTDKDLTDKLVKYVNKKYEDGN